MRHKIIQSNFTELSKEQRKLWSTAGPVDDWSETQTLIWVHLSGYKRLVFVYLMAVNQVETQTRDPPLQLVNKKLVFIHVEQPEDEMAPKCSLVLRGLSDSAPRQCCIFPFCDVMRPDYSETATPASVVTFRHAHYKFYIYMAKPSAHKPLSSVVQSVSISYTQSQSSLHEATISYIVCQVENSDRVSRVAGMLQCSQKRITWGWLIPNRASFILMLLA